MNTENYEWDEEKADDNFEKHGVNFEEAKTIFNDQLAMTMPDQDHSVGEDRFIDIGMSGNYRILVVHYTMREGNIRIISSREATVWEKRAYEEGYY